MAFHFKNYTNSIIGFIILFVFVLVPDVIFHILNLTFDTSAIGKSIIIAMLIALFINFSAAKKTIVSIITLCFLMQITQLVYFHCYGVFYGGDEIALMLSDKHEVLTTIAETSNISIVALIASFALYVASLVVYVTLFSKTPKMPYLSVLFIIALLVPFLQALSSDTSQKFQPNSTHLSIKNGLYAISFFAAQEIESVFDTNQVTLDKSQPSQ